MFADRQILAVVPARGGSKGVKLKNIRPLLGRPLIGYVGDTVAEAGCFDRVIVSTDHPKIAEVARSFGLAAPFLRPAALAGDRVGDHPVLEHALLQIERLDNQRYDVIVMLQPTCPLRRASHVTATIERLVKEDWDAVWTVSLTDLKYHPLKQLKLAPDGGMDFHDARGCDIVARQQLDPVYHRNGAAYAFSRRAVLDERTTKPRRTAAVVIDEPLVSIDTLADFKKVEQILKARDPEGVT
ncbi:MAG: acylneuraminate cytidylyltransferase family protein [Kiritimatiellae bacterium]|nr:acylneuraminate cytidylyltransferase family protein [Kiritimatiellia bacterium]